MEKNVSLIICSKDRAAQLEKCLQSINGEEMLAVGGELILVNNNSTDATKKIMLSFKEKAVFPVTVVDEPRVGLSHARNAGLLSSRGEIIIFTDDDCYLDKDYLITVSKVFESGDFDYCGGRILLYDKSDSERTACNSSNQKPIFKPHTFIPAGSIQGANMIFRRKVTKRVGLFDTMLGAGTPFPSEDIDYAARASLAGFRGAYIPELVVYHHHGRKPGDKSTRETLKSYDRGRGAYYAKFILEGHCSFAAHWIGQSIKRRGDGFVREVVAGIKYLFARKSSRRSLKNFESANKFVILASQRTGSTFLQHLLNSHGRIRVAQEIFNGNHKKNATKPMIKDFYYQRGIDPITYLKTFYSQKCNIKVSHIGFRLFYNHARKPKEKCVWDYLRNMHDLKIIHLQRRNSLENLLSLKLAEQSQKWMRMEGEEQIDYEPVRLEYGECVHFFEERERNIEESNAFFKENHMIDVFYEDLVADQGIETKRLLEFLGLKPRILKSNILKQNKRRLSAMITNYSELKNKFRNTKWEKFFYE